MVNQPKLVESLETAWSPSAETDIAVQGTSSMQGPAVSSPERERDLIIRKRILNYGWGEMARLDSSSATEPKGGERRQEDKH